MIIRHCIKADNYESCTCSQLCSCGHDGDSHMSNYNKSGYQDFKFLNCMNCPCPEFKTFESEIEECMNNE